MKYLYLILLLGVHYPVLVLSILFLIALIFIAWACQATMATMMFLSTKKKHGQNSAGKKL